PDSAPDSFHWQSSFSPPPRVASPGMLAGSVHAIANRSRRNMKCNSGAEMTLLNVGHFAGLGVGHCPEIPHGAARAGGPKRPTGLRRDGDAGRRKKNARALKFARKQAPVSLKGAN